MAAADDLDFWLGRWRCTWPGGEAVNTVERCAGGGAVLERFESAALRGVSLSAPVAGTWRQVWTDSEGGWLELVGGPTATGFELVAAGDGETPDRRMVFAAITATSLAWTWQRVRPDGTWQDAWTIDYRRVA